MSTDLTQAVSLEPDDQPVAPVETPAPVAEAAPPPANPDEAEPEGTVVNPGGEKLVPLSALAAARQAARDAKAQVEALKPKAEKVDQIVSEWQAAQPILERAKQMAQQPPPPAPKGPLSDQDAIEYAKDLDLYKADGTPDTDRAQRLAARQQAIATTQAQQILAPVQQYTAAQQAQLLRNQVLQVKDAQGNTVGQQYLDQVYASLPPDAAAIPQIANLAYYAAKGLEAHQGKGKAPAPPPVVHTESVGAHSAPTVSLSSVDHAFRQAADISEKRFTETAGRYKSGQTNSLE